MSQVPDSTRPAAPASHPARRLLTLAGQVAMVVACALLLLQLAGALWLFLRHSWAAITFPFPLDYGEGPILDQAIRLARLENIYRADLSQPPFVVANYPPLFPLVQAPFAIAFGPALWYGRAITVASVLLASMFAGLTLHRLTGDWPGSLAGALLLPSFAYVLHWSAFNRVDALALALACAALYAASRNPQRRIGVAVVAALLTAAIWTRQSYALAAPAACFVLLLHEPPRRRAFELAGMVAGASLALLGLVQLATGGGFYFNIVTANVNPFIMGNLRFRIEELWTHHQLLIGAAGLFVLLGAWWRPRSWWLIAPFLVGAVASAATIGKTGSNVNYLFELCAALSMACGALLAWAGRSSWLRAAGALGLALQVGAMSAWSADEYAPRVLDRMARGAELARMLDVVKGAGGPVLADEFMGLVPLAGQQLQFQPFELKQLADAGVWDERPLAEMIDNQEFPVILLYDPPDWDSRHERWTGRQLLYITTRYRAGERIADTIVYTPLR